MGWGGNFMRLRSQVRALAPPLPRPPPPKLVGFIWLKDLFNIPPLSHLRPLLIHLWIACLQAEKLSA